MKYSSIITIGVYTAIIIAFLLALKNEREDLYRPNANSDIYQRGRGSAYSQGIPDSEDNNFTLYNKLRIACRYDLNTVIWRRCLLLSIVSGFLVSFFLLRTLPSGGQLLVSILTIYIFCYLMCEFYKREVSKEAVNHIDKTIHMLNDREIQKRKKDKKIKRKKKSKW